MMAVTRSAIVNLVLVLLPLAFALGALMLNQPFYVTLATRMAILALAATGLNLALGLGGLVSFGHAAFFGIGGYAAGILATHALYMQPVLTWPFEIGGTESAPVIWLVAIAVAGLVALATGAISLRTSGVYFIMITLAFAQMIYYFAISWPAYGGEDGLSLPSRTAFPRVNTATPAGFFAVSYGALLAVDHHPGNRRIDGTILMRNDAMDQSKIGPFHRVVLKLLRQFLVRFVRLSYDQ